MSLDRYRIFTGVAMDEIEVSKGYVIKTGPLLSHLFGRLFCNVEEWARAHGYQVEKLEPK